MAFLKLIQNCSLQKDSLFNLTSCCKIIPNSFSKIQKSNTIISSRVNVLIKISLIITNSLKIKIKYNNKTKEWITNNNKVEINKCIQEADNYFKIQNLLTRTRKYTHSKNKTKYS